jgi:hypothetical protein
MQPQGREGSRKGADGEATEGNRQESGGGTVGKGEGKMISDRMLFVQCDSRGCDDRVDFSFSLVLNNPNWRQSELFEGWEIDWAGAQGSAYCPKHAKDEQ